MQRKFNDLDDLFGSDQSDDEDDEGADGARIKTALLLDETGKRREVHPFAQVDLYGPGKLSPRLKFVGPVILEPDLDGIGGGRGFVAACAIKPGTLLLAEEPLVKWRDIGIVDGSQLADGTPFEVRVLQAVLSRNSLSGAEEGEGEEAPTTRANNPCHPASFVAALKPFYPTSLSEYADPELVAELRSDARHLALLAPLVCSVPVQAGKGQGSEQPSTLGSPPPPPTLLGTDELLRLVLALRSNCFASGLYPHFAMFNHSCVPNCIKWQPLQTGSDRGASFSSSGAPAPAAAAAASAAGSWSEVRATRWIAAGEELTISYLEPREQSRQQRRTQLWGQFRFQCRCPLCFAPSSSVPHASCPAPAPAPSEENPGAQGVGGLDTEGETKGQCALARSLECARLSAAAEAATDLATEHQVQGMLEAAEEELVAWESSINMTAALLRREEEEEEEEVETNQQRPTSFTTPKVKKGKCRSNGPSFSALEGRQLEEALEMVRRAQGLRHMCAAMFTTTKMATKKTAAASASSTSTSPDSNHLSAASAATATRPTHRHHPLFTRTLRLVTDAAASALDLSHKHFAAAEARAATPNTPLLQRSRERHTQVLVAFLEASMELSALQANGPAGPDHPDLARTHLDVSDTIRTLLRIAPHVVVTSTPDSSDRGREVGSSGSNDTTSSALSPASPSQPQPPSIVNLDVSEEEEEEEEEEVVEEEGLAGDRKGAASAAKWATPALARQAEQKEKRFHERTRALYSGF